MITAEVQENRETEIASSVDCVEEVSSDTDGVKAQHSWKGLRRERVKSCFHRNRETWTVSRACWLRGFSGGGLTELPRPV